MAELKQTCDCRYPEEKNYGNSINSVDFIDEETPMVASFHTITRTLTDANPANVWLNNRHYRIGAPPVLESKTGRGQPHWSVHNITSAGHPAWVAQDVKTTLDILKCVPPHKSLGIFVILPHMKSDLVSKYQHLGKPWPVLDADSKEIPTAPSAPVALEFKEPEPMTGTEALAFMTRTMTASSDALKRHGNKPVSMSARPGQAVGFGVATTVPVLDVTPKPQRSVSIMFGSVGRGASFSITPLVEPVIPGPDTDPDDEAKVGDRRKVNLGADAPVKKKLKKDDKDV